MKIDFRKVTQAANNLRAEMYVDDLQVSILNMTPHEFNKVYDILEHGMIEGIDSISRDDRP